jgi:CRP-like cAMP-binding protein
VKVPVARLRALSVLEGFEDDELRELAQSMDTVCYREGERFGLGRGRLSLVLEGQVRVDRVDGNRRVDLGVFGAGALVGHVGLLLGIDPGAEAVVQSDCICAEMDAERFAEWSASSQAVAVKFHRFLARVLVRQLRGANARLVELARLPVLREYAQRHGYIA